MELIDWRPCILSSLISTEYQHSSPIPRWDQSQTKKYGVARCCFRNRRCRALIDCERICFVTWCCPSPWSSLVAKSSVIHVLVVHLDLIRNRRMMMPKTAMKTCHQIRCSQVRTKVRMTRLTRRIATPAVVERCCCWSPRTLLRIGRRIQ